MEAVTLLGRPYLYRPDIGKAVAGIENRNCSSEANLFAEVIE